ncbi:uncharacterized protein KY384_001737 [Bacidia gigantensis]|uniref:uncharacterized protein n=1 Tax=Bacidia gigantensis TaxID=2732470 RepID=UPI001D050760|nr:uncharacterized protein KY384_001737 [Bacidia gigantensis]KAG8532956.1 hypothetical protein KY384_001737 [Bacidia gigantensis]
MAIIKRIEMTVQVDGRDLREYEDPDADTENDGEITRYIQASSETPFTLSFKVPNDFPLDADCLSFEYTFDGNLKDDFLWRKEKFNSSKGKLSKTVKGYPVYDKKGFRLQEFMFAKINFGEDTELNLYDELSPSEVRSLSTIVCKVYRKEIIGSCTIGGGAEIVKDSVPPTEALMIKEKVLKGQGLTHSILTGEEIKASPQNTWPTRRVDKKPLATFTFKYRSNEALQHLHIIPREIPLEERDIETLTKTEMRELLRRQQGKQQHAQANVVTECNRDDEYKALLASAKSQQARRAQPGPNDEVVALDDGAVAGSPWGLQAWVSRAKGAFQGRG